jgi:hypothetical protein
MIGFFIHAQQYQYSITSPYLPVITEYTKIQSNMANESMNIKYLTTRHLQGLESLCNYVIKSLENRHFGQLPDTISQESADSFLKSKESDTMVTHNIEAVRSLHTLVGSMLDTPKKRPWLLEPEEEEEEKKVEALMISEKAFLLRIVLGGEIVRLCIVEGDNTADGKLLWLSGGEDVEE